MPNRGAPMVLLVCLLLAGCSFPARDESTTEGRDTSEYSGSGTGLAVHLENRAADPFHVTLVVRSSNGDEAARLETDVGPNATVEKWWSLGTGAYEVDMRYSARSGARTASGSDIQRVEVGGECEELSRVGWRYLRFNETFGSAFQGKSCATADGAP